MLHVSTHIDYGIERFAEEARAYRKQAAGYPDLDFSTLDGVVRAREMIHVPEGDQLVAKRRVEVLAIPGATEGVTARVVRVPQPAAVYLQFHMGGWLLGSAALSDTRNVEIADRCGVSVVSVDYRLAPESPAPAQMEDAEAAGRWLLAQSGDIFGTNRLILGGESAGATLAVLLALRLRDTGTEVDVIAGMNLLYGVYDITSTPSQRRASSFTLAEDVRRHVYPGVAVEELRAGAYSPLYADLSGLPPALFTVGDADSLVDDTLFMAARWDAAGNRTLLHVYPECEHGFEMLPIGMAHEARTRIDSFISACALPPK